MRILLAASEVTPFAKTGGLGDVAGALPRALAALGLDVAVALPLYPRVRRRKDPLEVVADRVGCNFAGENRPFRLLKTTLPGAPAVPVFLVENPWMFEAEEQFYGNEPGSYGDGHLRFLYFSRAVIEIPEAAGFHPDVFHLNDWQTALVGPLLRTVHARDPELSRAATVLTIHNLAYQGVFPVPDLRHAGVPDFLLREGRLLEKGSGNLLAGGIRFADALSTVSRSYAHEILTPEFGEGLDALLHWRRDLLTGIVNGLDTDAWNPATDAHLPAHYTADDLQGKAVCRGRLLEASGLEPTEGPVFGVVSRLVAQKGLDLVIPVMERVLDREPTARLVVLGSGESGIEDGFRRLAARFGRRVHARFTFDPPFSSLVEAGADVFLMPSRFEPCGLNQLISMRYGTPPVVRAVGGLRDTVTDATPEAVEGGRATGFTFGAFDSGALEDAVGRAIALFRRPEAFDRVRRAGMTQDWSWTRSAREYARLYEEAFRRHAEGKHLEVLLSDLPKEPLEADLPALAPVPDGYARDSLVLIPYDPHTLFCQWELGGEHSRGILDALDSELRRRIRYDLVVTEEWSGNTMRFDAGGITRQWYATVAPGRRYRGEVFMNVPGSPPRRVLDHPPVTMPGDARPEQP